MSRNFGEIVFMLHASPYPTSPLSHPLLQEMGVELEVARLDKIHPRVSGNKFFKLRYNLLEAKKKHHTQVLTFGGAYSNHIYATAFAAKEMGLTPIGIIRGEEEDVNNPTLEEARAAGMTLFGVSREKYKQKSSPEFLEALSSKFGSFYLIPEGGTNDLAVQGTSEMLTPSHQKFSHLCTPVGTGGTLAGLASALAPHQSLLGFSALKGEGIKMEVEELMNNFRLSSAGKWQVLTQYHHGGYAKWTEALISFIHWFWDEFNIPLDPIYTGKMAFGCWDLIQKKFFPPGSKILMFHTGGLQGNIGFTTRTGIRLPTLSV